MKALTKSLLAGAVLAALPMASALACTTTAWNGGTVGATAGDPTTGVARYSGECGLKGAAAGNSHVTDNSPNGEANYRARFYVYTGTATGSPVIFQATDADGAAGSALVQVVYDTANNQFDFTSGAAAGSATVADNKWYSVEFYYDAGNAITAKVQGSQATSPSVVTFAGAPAAGTVQSARLGIIGATTAGDTMKFDEFESTRSTTTEIGRLCRGDANGTEPVNIFDRTSIVNEILGNALGQGQPDCNEDGGVNVFDRTCIVNIILAGGACPS